MFLRALHDIDEVASQVTYSTIASHGPNPSTPSRRPPPGRLGSSLPLPPTPLDQLLHHPPSAPATITPKTLGSSTGRGMGGVLVQHYTSSRHYLREVLDVSLSKKPVQVDIFKSPVIRQQSGNKNVYDPERFRWVAGGGSRTRSRSASRSRVDEFAVDYRDILYAKQVNAMFDH